MVGLKSIVNQVYECRNDSCPGMPVCSEECRGMPPVHQPGIDPALLDSILKKEFNELGLEPPYIYGVFNLQKRRIIQASDTLNPELLLKTPHTASLSCIFRNNANVLGVWFPDEGSRAFRKVIWQMVFSILLIAVLLFGLAYTVYSFSRQKKLSQMKSDFVNNMTHEFKTPISTISLASEMLLKPAVLNSGEKLLKYARIIYDENLRLQAQVDHVLQIAVLDRSEYELKRSGLDLNALVTEVLESFRISLKESDGKVKAALKANPSVVPADPLHTRNILLNLLDNANKYSGGKADITVITDTVPGGVILAVEDKGIGISHEHQRHIFKKLFRVSTGNVHDVKGFGLGLYYVKTMVEAQGGTIQVKSEPGKGSRFEVFFPFGESADEEA
jgi:two-component system phosphate regulon sensor histidine kinase PhoR